MIGLHQLKDTSRTRKSRKRVGRGIGSGLGKTCGRGMKGAAARSGYRAYLGYEGGQFRTFAKMPVRGFSNARFRKPYDVINLRQINDAFEDGETVNLHSLVAKGFLSGATYGIKVLGDGELHKKVTLEVDALSKSAREKLKSADITVKIL